MTAPLLRGTARTAVRVDLTPRAARQVRSLLAERPGQSYGLRVSVDEPVVDETLVGEPVVGEPVYRLSLSPLPHPGDLVLPRNGFEVFVPERDAPRVDGVRIDFVESPSTAGFTVDPLPHPPRPRRADHPRRADRPRPLVPTGQFDEPGQFGESGAAAPGPPDVVAQVQAAIVLVRPALQRDGGDLALVAVDGGTAHVVLAGACSGCSSALITLAEMIERVIVEAVPAIDRVVLVS